VRVGGLVGECCHEPVEPAWVLKHALGEMQLLREELHPVTRTHGDAALLQKARVLLPAHAVAQEHGDRQRAAVCEPVPADREEIRHASQRHGDRVQIDAADMRDDVLERLLVGDRGGVERVEDPTDRPEQERPRPACGIEHPVRERVADVCVNHPLR